MAEKDTSIILTMRENLKKIIKGITLVFGLVLIIFISFYYISFDPEKINWGEWGANACILIGIMIFGILMGSSIGKDIQQEKPKGSYQTKCQEYLFVYETIKDIAIFTNSFNPNDEVDIVSTTGQPNFLDSNLTSILVCFFKLMSDLLSATTIGIPSSKS